jgi:hypothetical protein
MRQLRHSTKLVLCSTNGAQSKGLIMLKKTFPNANVMAVGGANLINAGDLHRTIVRTEFQRCSGNFRGQAVHSLYGAELIIAGRSLFALAGSDNRNPTAVHVYDRAEMAIVAAKFDLANGAIPTTFIGSGDSGSAL